MEEQAIRSARADRTAERHRREIEDRTFAFAVAVVKLLKALGSDVPQPLSDEVARLAMDLGARVSEGVNSSSRRRYLSDMGTARREAAALDYWLRLLAATDSAPAIAVQTLLDEAYAIFAVLTDLCIQMRHRIESEPDSDED